MVTPLEFALSHPRSCHRMEPSAEGVCSSYEDVPSQSLHLKLFALVYDKRVWKRRLLLLTESMLLVMKRPDDHYLKNAICFADCSPALAYVSRKEVFILSLIHI